MRDVERAVENVLSERISVEKKNEWSPIRRLEDFSLNHMKSLALGAGGAILGLSAMMLFWSPTTRPFEQIDPVVVGSILNTDQSPSRLKWLPVKKPVQIFSLEAQQVNGMPANYSAKYTEQGHLQDSLSFTHSAQKSPDIRVTLTRGAMKALPATLYIDMIRQQSERGFSVSKAGQSDEMQSKFGPLEVADMTFSEGEKTPRACLAFRSASTEAMISVSGWYCAAEMAAAERPELACILDKVILLKSGHDKELRRYFTQAEKNRTPCATSRISTGRKPTWLDSDGKVPAFRSDITGSIEIKREKKN
jgi:hypothetical protein